MTRTDVDRFLGAGWASVHGPSDLQEALIWTLDQGFRGLLPAPSPRPVDWRGLHARREGLPFRFPAVRVSTVIPGESLVEAGLASAHAGERKEALAAVRQAVILAMELGCPTVILEPGLVSVPGEVPHSDLGDRAAAWTAESAQGLYRRQRARVEVALDAACRSLHALLREYPEVHFCLTLSRNALGVGCPAGLAAILEDLSRYRLGYWHDTAAAGCRQQFLGEDPGEVLDIGSKAMSGMTLGDFGGDECYLPPGAGGVDYPLLSTYRQPSSGGFPVVIELAAAVSPEEIAGIHAFLAKFGL